MVGSSAMSDWLSGARSTARGNVIDAESDDLRPGGRQEPSDADRPDPTGPLTLRRTLVGYVVSDA